MSINKLYARFKKSLSRETEYTLRPSMYFYYTNTKKRY